MIDFEYSMHFLIYFASSEDNVRFGFHVLLFFLFWGRSIHESSNFWLRDGLIPPRFLTSDPSKFHQGKGEYLNNMAFCSGLRECSVGENGSVKECIGCRNRLPTDTGGRGRGCASFCSSHFWGIRTVGRSIIRFRNSNSVTRRKDGGCVGPGI